VARTPKPDPEKYCRHCGTQMKRKRYNGTLEDMGRFLRRKFCDQQCMAHAMQKNHCNSISHSRMKAQKHKENACHKCGSMENLHLHHLNCDPRDNTPSNLRTLCASCHRLYHSPKTTETGEPNQFCRICGKPSARRDLCNTHLTRFKKYGDPCLKKIKRGSLWVLKKLSGSECV